MGIYSTFNYDDRADYGTKYGDAARFAYSALPFTATATDYSEITLSWTQPQGAYTKIRLVRSQDGYPETEEDGVILWSWIGETNEYGIVAPEAGYEPRITNFVDGPLISAPKLLPGVFSYYRIWLYTTTEEWVVAGDAYTLVTKSHSYVSPDKSLEITTHDKFMDLIPKVFTTATQSPIDEVDKNSILYNFLSGLSFGLDEIMTYADSILPESTGRYLGPELVTLSSFSLGLQQDSFAASKNQKRLIREAYYMYSHKGTRNALETYVESLTGWAPNIVVSPNILLSPQDSTFYKGLGRWTPVGDCTLTVSQEVEAVNNSTEIYATDIYYMGKAVVATVGGAIDNGSISPITSGAHVSAGSAYNLTARIRTSSGSGSVTPSVTWYDRLGNALATVSKSSIAVTSSWSKVELGTVVAPGGLFPVKSYSITSGVATLDLGAPHGFVVGEDIYNADTVAAITGVFTVTAKTETTISFAVTSSDVATTSGTGVVSSNDFTENAEYASVRFTFDATETYYVDMVQLADYLVTDYYEAKSVTVFLNPKKTNWILNPSFNPSNADAWYLASPTPGTAITATKTYVSPSTLEDSVTGTHMLKVSTVSDEPVNLWTNIGEVTSGVYYVFSVHMATLATGVTESGAQIAIDVYNGLELPTTPTESEWADAKVETLIVPTGDVTNTWQKFFVRAFIPSTISKPVVRIRVLLAGSGNEVLFDDAQMEVGYTPTDHFDGDIPASFGAVWEGGVANASNARSHIYPNKGVKITRLTENIKDFLPINTPYVIETYAGVETRVNPD